MLRINIKLLLKLNHISMLLSSSRRNILMETCPFAFRLAYSTDENLQGNVLQAVNHALIFLL